LQKDSSGHPDENEYVVNKDYAFCISTGKVDMTRKETKNQSKETSESVQLDVVNTPDACKLMLVTPLQ
jgi:hypothetical protein